MADTSQAKGTKNLFTIYLTIEKHHLEKNAETTIVAKEALGKCHYQESFLLERRWDLLECPIWRLIKVCWGLEMIHKRYPHIWESGENQ